METKEHKSLPEPDSSYRVGPSSLETRGRSIVAELTFDIVINLIDNGLNTQFGEVRFDVFQVFQYLFFVIVFQPLKRIGEGRVYVVVVFVCKKLYETCFYSAVGLVDYSTVNGIEQVINCQDLT